MAEAPIRIDLGFVNAYLVKAERGFVLVDAGTAAHYPKLEAALGRAGCGKRDLRLIALSHADPDHAGSAAALSSAYGAPIALHAGDAPMFERGEAVKRHGNGPLASLFIRFANRPSEVVQARRAELELTEGLSLTEYGLEAKVLHLPGHTPGSIALLLADGSLLAGDVLANMRRPGLSPFIWDAGLYNASLERLKGLAGSIRAVYPGHGAPFAGEAILDIKPLRGTKP